MHTAPNVIEVSWASQGQNYPNGTLDCTNGTIESLENGPKRESFEPKSKPVGRPVSLPEAYRYILARDGALKYAEKLADDALNATRASDRREAIAEITDRTSGKAVQNVRHAGVFMVMAPGAEALAALDGWAEDE